MNEATYGSKLDFDALRAEAMAAPEACGRTQTEIAGELGVHRSAVSRAVKTVGPKFQDLQRRIIEHLTPYRIERRVVFEARRKA